MEYSFCEPHYAHPLNLWHIRQLTEAVVKLGGGADTSALCGRFVSWDLDIEITGFHLEHNVCKKCLEIYRKEAVK